VYQDKTITCIDCGADFTFTADEQEFYASHQLGHEPKRCKPCREKRKSMPHGRGPGVRRGDPGGMRPTRVGEGGPGGARQELRARYKIICNACGKEDEVPFQPKEGREVFCRNCFAERRG
jgi:CxxC-x17-CxxC domain-containing protein